MSWMVMKQRARIDGPQAGGAARATTLHVAVVMRQRLHIASRSDVQFQRRRIGRPVAGRDADRHRSAVIATPVHERVIRIVFGHDRQVAFRNACLL